MSLYGNTSLLGELRHRFEHGTMVEKLIFVNIFVFILDGLLRLIFFLVGNIELYKNVSLWFQTPSSLKQLIWQPWSLVTYMFLHSDLFHIFFNMLVLYIFGRIVHDLLSNRKILPIFLLGGISGALLYVIAYNIFPVFQPINAHLLGASAGVMAIMLAATTLRPDYVIHLMFIGPVRIKYIALFFIVLDIIGITSGNSGGKIAHLGGALCGFLFVKQLTAGKDWSTGINKGLDYMMSMFKSSKGSRPRVVFKSDKKQQNSRTYDTDNTSSFSKEKQTKMNEILDKIADHGYESLTKEEREFLFKISKED